MDTNDFFKNLKPLPSFQSFLDEDHFKPVPSDWYFILTDVQGSTQAIQEGRYKDVNTLGAASIAAAKNVMKNEEFPFVFGGDGATLLIPPKKYPAVMDGLLSLQSLAKQRFDLKLRVGALQISKILSEGHTLSVGKYELASGCFSAMIQGTGVPAAELQIKSQTTSLPTPGFTPERHPSSPTLDGLSCRWRPCPNQNGTILCMIIEAHQSCSNPAYREVWSAFEETFNQGLEVLNPTRSTGKYNSITQCVRDEIRYQKNLLSLSFLKRLFEIPIAVFLFKLRIPLPIIRRYEHDIASHSDFRKFDNAIRMVIDCSQEKAEQIESALSKLHRENKIYYGIHRADESLMTCFVKSLKPGSHIHFIDAANGGYAAAATQLKKQKLAL